MKTKLYGPKSQEMMQQIKKNAIWMLNHLKVLMRASNQM
jgi:hypothetical protein